MKSYNTYKSIKHITYNTGDVFEFNVKSKIRYAGNAKTFRSFTKKANKAKVVNDILIIPWQGYLISISALNKGIYNILIMQGRNRLAVNIFAKNEITTLVLPELVFGGDSFYLAQLEQLVACYLFYNPRYDLAVSDEAIKIEDIPRILKDYQEEYSTGFLNFLRKTG